MDLATFRSQLAPHWSGVNIAIVVVLFLLKWYLLAIAMAAYVIWGQRAGLNLARPQTFVVAGTRLGRALSRALSDLGDSESGKPADTGLGTGKPDPFSSRATEAGATRTSGAAGSDDFERWRQQEAERLRADRETLEVERAAFEKEKAAWQATKGSSA